MFGSQWPSLTLGPENPGRGCLAFEVGWRPLLKGFVLCSQLFQAAPQGWRPRAALTMVPFDYQAPNHQTPWDRYPLTVAQASGTDQVRWSHMSLCRVRTEDGPVCSTGWEWSQPPLSIVYSGASQPSTTPGSLHFRSTGSKTNVFDMQWNRKINDPAELQRARRNGRDPQVFHSIGVRTSDVWFLFLAVQVFQMVLRQPKNKFLDSYSWSPKNHLAL